MDRIFSYRLRAAYASSILNRDKWPPAQTPPPVPPPRTRTLQALVSVALAASRYPVPSAEGLFPPPPVFRLPTPFH